MSKLDRLIAELCPDGLEYKRLGDVCLDSDNISRVYISLQFAHMKGILYSAESQTAKCV